MVRPDTALRAELADRIIQYLVKKFPDSTVRLRGSLASDRADEYSDIDLLWEAPDALIPACFSDLPSILGGIAPLLSFRADPDFQLSRKRRLFFVCFESYPLFWRVDLSVLAASLNGDESFDVDNPVVRDFSGWSWPESALFNGVAALKSHLRGNDENARALLARAFDRLQQNYPADLSLREQILRLVEAAKAEDLQVMRLARELEKLVEDYL